MKRLTCPICRFSGFTGGEMNFHKCGRNGSFFCGNNSTLWISPPFGRLFSRFDFHIVRSEATHGGKLCGVRAADGWSKIEKILGRRTIPGSFFSGHRPLCDTQARTRSLQSEPQSSPLVILVERPQPTANTLHDLKPSARNVPLSRPAEYRQW